MIKINLLRNHPIGIYHEILNYLFKYGGDDKLVQFYCEGNKAPLLDRIRREGRLGAF